MPKGVRNKRYTPEFKKLVVKTMQKERISYRETARQFEISDDKRVAVWERIYLEEGRKGLPSSGGAAAARGVRRSSCRKRRKKICWQKSSGCVLS